MVGLPPSSTLFPYTTLFRSQDADDHSLQQRVLVRETAIDGPRGQPGVLGDARNGGALNSAHRPARDRKSTRLNSSHVEISYAVFCLKKKIRLLSPAAHVDQA